MTNSGYAVTLSTDGLTATVMFSDGDTVVVPRWDASTDQLFYIVRDSWEFTPTASFTQRAFVIGVRDNTIELYGPHAHRIRDICPLQIMHYKDFARFMMQVLEPYHVVLIVDSDARQHAERYLVHRALSCYDDRAQLYPAFTMDGELYAGYSGLPGNLVAFEDEQVRRLIEEGKIYDVSVDNDGVLCNTRPAFRRGVNKTVLFNVGGYLCLMTNCLHKDFKLSWLEQVREVAYSYNNGVQIFIVDEDVFKDLVEKNDLQNVDITVASNTGHKYDWSEIFTDAGTDTLREYFTKYNIAAENEEYEINRLNSLFGTDNVTDLRKAVTSLL